MMLNETRQCVKQDRRSGKVSADCPQPSERRVSLITPGIRQSNRRATARRFLAHHYQLPKPPSTTGSPIMSTKATPPADQCIFAQLGPEQAMQLLKRLVCAAIGLTFVTIGFLGIFVPGLPTTGPLIAASFFLAKSHPRLERLLIHNRVFSRYSHYLDGSTAMPLRARYWALGWMWLSITISSASLIVSGAGGALIVATMFAAGLVGSGVIMRFRRHVGIAQQTAPARTCTVNNTREDQAIDRLFEDVVAVSSITRNAVHPIQQRDRKRVSSRTVNC